MSELKSVNLNEFVYPEGYHSSSQGGKFVNSTYNSKLDVIKELEEGKIYLGKVVSASPNGVMVEIAEGIREFIPKEELFLPDDERNPEYMNGEMIYYKVLEASIPNGLVLSRKAAQAEIRERKLKDLKVGDVVLAKIYAFTDKKIFLDLGGVKGVLDITEWSWGFEDKFTGKRFKNRYRVDSGNFIELKIIDFHKSPKGGVEAVLSRKAMFPNPWDKLEKVLMPNQDILEKVKTPSWQEKRQKLRLALKKARTPEQKQKIYNEMDKMNKGMPIIEGVVIYSSKENTNINTIFISIYKDPISGDEITGRSKYPKHFEVHPGDKVEYMITEFNKENKTIFGVIKRVIGSTMAVEKQVKIIE